MKHILPIAVIVTLILSSCTKHEAPMAGPDLDNSIYEQVKSCHTGQLYDSMKLASGLQGKWKEAWMDYAGARHASYSDLRVTFTPGGVYTMEVNSRMMSAGSWRVINTDGGNFGLKMKDTLNAYGGLPGNVLLCGGPALF